MLKTFAFVIIVLAMAAPNLIVLLLSLRCSGSRHLTCAPQNALAKRTIGSACVLDRVDLLNQLCGSQILELDGYDPTSHCRSRSTNHRLSR
jgi:hypothetical protein